MNSRIWFQKPATNFLDGTPERPSKVNGNGHLGESSDWITALPIGNGRLGGLVFGGVNEEIIKINEETLWSGEPKDSFNPQWSEYLPKVRKAIFEGRYEEADQFARKMQGPFNESYMPLGNLRFHFHHGENVEEYYRELLLDDAVVRVCYKVENHQYIREYFCSNPQDAIIIRLACSEAGGVSFDVTMDSMIRYTTMPFGDNGLILKGNAPIHVEPNYMGEIPNAIIYEENKGMKYEAHVKASTEGGRVWADQFGLHIEEASEVILYLTAVTSFNGFDNSPSENNIDVGKACETILAKISEKDYGQMISEHMKDFHQLYDRVELNLGSHENELLPTDLRLTQLRSGDNDFGMYVLFFNFGRYLLISSSRQGNLPANLQGIWNEEVRPPWSCNWTLDINAQMNYWLAECCNLSECHEPFLKYIEQLRVNGRKTAQACFGAKGWASGLNGDIWNGIHPVGAGNGTPTWANWLMSGPWLCQHLWLHYEYQLDKEYLENSAYPVMKECAEFLLDSLVEDAKGYLGVCPGTSPERTFHTEDGQTASVSFGTTMDNALTKELFLNVMKACELLNIDDEFAAKVKEAYDKLLPYKIGRYGQLQEWSQDLDDPNVKDAHHSFLYGLYPGWDITPSKTPELAEASRISMEFRDFVLQGWGLAWCVSLWARLHEAQNSYKALQLLVTKLLTPNLLGKIFPDGIFQIDANFGGTAGIAEMLLQSHEGFIHVLPALPEEWSEGTARGLKARRGFTVDLEWKCGVVKEIRIQSQFSDSCKVKVTKNMRVVCEEDLVTYTRDCNSILEFYAESGRKYILKELRV